MKRTCILLFVCTVFCLVSCLVSCLGRKKPSDTSANGVLVVATSSWTAAYARAAGAENVVLLAPFDMVHPSEYELRPADIPQLMDATLIVFAGYEVMTGRLKKGLDLPAGKLLQIVTEYNLESMEKSIMMIAAKLGTETVARENLSEIRRIFEDGKKDFEAQGMTGLPVVAHRFQSSLVRELGFAPVVVFGPSSPEASEIVAVSKTGAFIIIDNFHNPVGQPFNEVLPGARYEQLLNFPGQKGTKSLADVVRYNILQLKAQVPSLRESD